MSDDTPQSVGALIRAIRIAQARMSRSNTHRVLLGRCAAALVDVSMQLHEARKVEHGEAKSE